MKSITSPQNGSFRTLRECLASKGIREHGVFLLSGEKAVGETLSLFPERIEAILFSEAKGSVKELASKPDHADEYLLAPALFSELDVSGTGYPILVVRTPEIEKLDLTKSPQGLEIACALGDPSNVGALVRSAAAFGASRIILLEESANPFHPKSVRAASATTLMMNFVRGPSIKAIQPDASWVALDMAGQRIDRFQWPKDVRLIVGEEGQGIPGTQTFSRVSIPMNRQVESLNATVAISIALYAYCSQHRT